MELLAVSQHVLIQCYSSSCSFRTDLLLWLKQLKGSTISISIVNNIFVFGHLCVQCCMIKYMAKQPLCYFTKEEEEVLKNSSLCRMQYLFIPNIICMMWKLQCCIVCRLYQSNQYFKHLKMCVFKLSCLLNSQHSTQFSITCPKEMKNNARIVVIL